MWATALGLLLNNRYHSSEKRKTIKTLGQDVPRGCTEGELRIPRFHPCPVSPPRRRRGRSGIPCPLLLSACLGPSSDLHSEVQAASPEREGPLSPQLGLCPHKLHQREELPRLCQTQCFVSLLCAEYDTVLLAGAHLKVGSGRDKTLNK